MIRMTTRLLFVLLLAILGIPLLLILNHSDEGKRVNKLWKNEDHGDDNGEFSYGVIMDAGSTGSRVFLYKWTSSSTDELIDIKPALDNIGKPVVRKVSPGLSSFASKTNEAAEYIKPLLDYAIEFIPESQREYTPVFLFATAGMRLVPLEAQNAILHDLHTKLPELTPMQIMKEHIRVIEGKWEGIYSWVAVNYILGNFAKTRTTANLESNRLTTADRKKTVGMIDMGGASCQIAYELPQNDTFLSESVENINLGSRDDSADFKYKLFVTTFLGYGVNEGLRKYEQQLSATVNKSNLTYIRDDCMPVNLQKTITREDNTSFVRKGIGSWGECVAKLSEIVRNHKALSKPTCQPSCFFGSIAAPNVSLSDMELYGFSEYWYSVQDVLALGGKYNYTHLRTKSNQFCSQRWSAIQLAAKKSLYQKADADRLKTQCFKSAWITAVLHSGFSISENTNRFQSAHTISGQEVQWALGAMIYNMRFFPIKNSGFNLVVNKHPDGTTSPPPIVIFLLVACCIICLFFTYTTLTKNPRITPGMRRNQSLWSYMAVPMEESMTTY